jgi:hypothetical protein
MVCVGFWRAWVCLGGMGGFCPVVAGGCGEVESMIVGRESLDTL